jgi:hypothetical protein
MGLLAPLRRDQASPQDSKIIQSYFYFLLAPFPSTRSHIPCHSCSAASVARTHNTGDARGECVVRSGGGGGGGSVESRASACRQSFSTVGGKCKRRGKGEEDKGGWRGRGAGGRKGRRMSAHTAASTQATRRKRRAAAAAGGARAHSTYRGAPRMGDPAYK